MRALIPAAVAAATLLAPAAAEAATIAYDGDTLVYTAAPGEDNRTGPWEGFLDASRVSIGDAYGVTIVSQTDRCTAVGDRFECEVPARLVFRLGDGDDAFTVAPVAWDVPVEVDAGAGDDVLSGYAPASASQAQVFDGGPGDDTLDGAHGDDVVRGGPGADEVHGGDGDDTVEGGEGDDALTGDRYGEPGTDTIDGGPGFDRMDSDYVDPARPFNPAVAISFDGVANDGRPGENDNIVAVEKLDTGTAGTFTGSAGADDFFVKSDFNGEASTIRGLEGADRLVGHDRVETIDGGPGDDTIEGGLNDDVLTGGPGRDAILGDSSQSTCNFLACRIPFGNDVIHARDGERDSIDCGIGDDRAFVDDVDVVANCERVELAAPGAEQPPRTASRAGAGAAPQNVPSRRAALAVVGATRLQRVVRRGLRLRVSGLSARAAVRVSVRHRARRVASGAGRASATGVATVVARFTPAARQRLRRARTVRLTVVAVGTTRTVVLRGGGR